MAVPDPGHWEPVPVVLPHVLLPWFWVCALLQGSDPERVALVSVATFIIITRRITTILLDSQFKGQANKQLLASICRAGWLQHP